MEPLTFYQNIEPKDCTKCGCKMEEQAECYVELCDHCLPINQLEIATK